MTTPEYLDWVYERAAVLMNEQVEPGFIAWTARGVRDSGTASTKALLAHILKHEEAPVDPLLEEARQVAADSMAAFECCGQGFASGAINAVRTGNDDDSIQVIIAHAALQRGGEIERKRRS